MATLQYVGYAFAFACTGVGTAAFVIAASELRQLYYSLGRF